ncbi:ROK family protein [Tessaracoccus sp. OH4464_COT-324]|uniref:ROK family protein n=1 Tax=Tessaracoccus sp. OH4464_COT-324 TaxID=2491059 RepID=UPI000F64465C|nr:ROK family protein [Tessaracoccus sp. OH4464_COT-324]RRD46290.1 ROK family protein [Tessaracoccus sp. OH4464_COT-324]
MGKDANSAARAKRARRLLHSLRARGAATLATLAKDAGVSRPTASLIVADLEAEGLVAQSATSSGAGRPAALYSFAPRHGFVVGLDIQRDEVAIAAASIAGKVLHATVRPLTERARDSRLQELCRALREVVEELEPKHGQPVCGFASTTGIVDGAGLILRSYSVPQWHGLRLSQLLTERSGIRFHAANDINSAAYGEFATRVSDGRIDLLDTLLHIRVFAGFRTGLILGGDIHQGHHWHAGEINDSLDGELRARLDTETSHTRWALRAAATISTVSSAIDPTLVVISTAGLEDEDSATEMWAHLSAMRLPTAPKIDMEPGELGGAASTIGALSLALRDAESHFLHARTRYPVAVSGLQQIIDAHRAYADRRKAEAHRHAVVVSEPLRVGVVGLGVRSQLAQHVESPENKAVLVGACDPDPLAATRVGHLLHKAPEDCPVFTSVRELIESGIGAAFVTSPDDTHEATAIELLEAGIPVYLEKPLATSIDGSTRILRAAYKSRARLYVGHNMRHMSFVRQLRQLIHDDAIGEVQTIWCRHFVGHGGDYYFKDWHADRRHSHGLLLQKAAHDIDVMHWLAGSEASEVVGMGDLMIYSRNRSRTGQGGSLMPDWFSLDNWPPESLTGLNPIVDVEDLSMLMMRMRSGVLASYQQCHFSPDYWRNYTVIGSRGRIENFGDGEGGVIRLWNRRGFYDADGDEQFPILGDLEGHDDADALTVAEFLRFVRTGAPTDTSPVSAWYAVVAGIQATESLRDGSTPRRIPTLPAELTEYFLNNQV